MKLEQKFWCRQVPPKINSFVKSTAQQAIDDATAGITKGQASEYYIVKVIAVVRKQTPPVEVEWVDGKEF